MSDKFHQARQLFIDGTGHFDAGRFEEAQACFETSLALLPGRVSTLVNLAATLNALGRHEAALVLADEAIAAQPDDVDAWYQRSKALVTLRRHAEAVPTLERLLELRPDDALAWFHRAQALEYVDRQDDALGSYERAIELDPGFAQAHSHRASILKDQGRTGDAAAAYRQAIALGGDAVLNAFYLAALTGHEVPATPPRSYVEGLFDGYAGSFEEHLVGTLGYRAHNVLIEQLLGIGPRAYRSALDLGCGTGLCGPLVKPRLAEHIDGVDLSAPMLERARALGVYDRLEQADLLEHLARTGQHHDLVLAADVFIYVGALDAVFGAVRRVLEPGGDFCFSVEEAGDAIDFELRASLRYAHSQRYLRELAARCGFEVLRLHPQAIREEQRQPIAGLYACLRKT